VETRIRGGRASVGRPDVPATHPVVIRVDQLHLAGPGRFVHAHPELRRDPIDVGHVDIDEAWRAGVARVFGEVDDRVVSSQPDIERQVRLEAVLELDLELEPGPPRDRHSGISNPQDGRRVGTHQKTETRSAGVEPHAVALAHPERLVEGIDVAHDVGAVLGRRMRVDSKKHDGRLLTCLAAPHLGPADEETLVTSQPVEHRRLLLAAGDPVCRVPDSQPGQVAEVLARG
jgi:hypothetical protein